MTTFQIFRKDEHGDQVDSTRNRKLIGKRFYVPCIVIQTLSSVRNTKIDRKIPIISFLIVYAMRKTRKLQQAIHCLLTIDILLDVYAIDN